MATVDIMVAIIPHIMEEAILAMVTIMMTTRLMEGEKSRVLFQRMSEVMVAPHLQDIQQGEVQILLPVELQHLQEDHLQLEPNRLLQLPGGQLTSRLLPVLRNQLHSSL